MHTVKPLDTETLVASAAKTGQVVTAEEHSVIGGLGSAVCDALAEQVPGAGEEGRRRGRVRRVRPRGGPARQVRPGRRGRRARRARAAGVGAGDNPIGLYGGGLSARLRLLSGAARARKACGCMGARLLRCGAASPWGCVPPGAPWLLPDCRGPCACVCQTCSLYCPVRVRGSLTLRYNAGACGLARMGRAELRMARRAHGGNNQDGPARRCLCGAHVLCLWTSRDTKTSLNRWMTTPPAYT